MNQNDVILFRLFKALVSLIYKIHLIRYNDSAKLMKYYYLVQVSIIPPNIMIISITISTLG